VLDLGELECERDRLSRELTRVSGALAERAHAQAQARLQLEAMLANPARYRLARISCAALGESGCGEYAVRPRLGLLGMLAGWWEVKLSSGCP
jgi:hypothetical protein